MAATQPIPGRTSTGVKEDGYRKQLLRDTKKRAANAPYSSQTDNRNGKSFGQKVSR